MTCPICASQDAEELYPRYEGPCITSDMQIVPDTLISNRVCRSCGFIFNAAGVRGRTEDFYGSAYSLRMHAPGARNVNFTGDKPTPLAELQLGFLDQSLTATAGRLLEIGAGKGEFLSRFVPARPEWKVTAIEPSSAATILAERLPSVDVHHGPYATFTPRRTFDVIVALGVIEHVDRPIELLEWICTHLSSKGLLFVSMPNFEANPSDLFCVDHLSKIIPTSLQMITARAGFEIDRTQPIGVGLMTMLRPARVAADRISVFQDAVAVGRRNEMLARQTIDGIERARANADEFGFAIFGLNIAGIFAPLFCDFDPQNITAYIDENETMHGAVINGRPVVGLLALRNLGVRHIAITASPVYHAQIKSKLAQLGLTAYP